MKKEHKAKENILMCTAVVILCATLLSTYFVGGLYAKYTTKKIDRDSARVAAFDIEQEGTIFETIKADVTPGTTKSVELIITNKSEVAAEYTLTATNVTGTLPLKFKLASKGEKTPDATVDSYEDDISISSARQIPGDHTDEYTLDVIWEPSAKGEDDLALMGMVDYITVSVTVTQID